MLKYIPYIFNKTDIENNFENQKQLDNWLLRKVKSEKIIKVRNGLYVSLDQTGSINVSKFEIASKISNDSFICYHSALEYYGLANQVFRTIIVGSTSRINSFEFDSIEYLCKLTRNTEFIDYIKYAGVRVTTLERTIIDCIDDINLAGGIDELLNSLSQIKFIDEKRLLDVLKSCNKVLLYQKVGYILEQFNSNLRLSDEFFNECQMHLTNQVKYFLKDEFIDIVYCPRWKLMAPKNLKTRIYGGI